MKKGRNRSATMEWICVEFAQTEGSDAGRAVVSQNESGRIIPTRMNKKRRLNWQQKENVKRIFSYENICKSQMHIYFKRRWHKAYNHTPTHERCGSAAAARLPYCKYKRTRVRLKDSQLRTKLGHIVGGLVAALDVDSNVWP